MKNIFSRTYKIEFDGVIYLNFQFMCLIVAENIIKEYSPAIKEIILRDFDAKTFSNLWKKIESKVDIHEKTGSDKALILEVTEKEICNYLCLAILVSKILNSKYFILIKNAFPMWTEMITKGIDPDDINKFDRGFSTLEGFAEVFEKDARVLARLAKIRFINKPDFINKIESAFDYVL